MINPSGRHKTMLHIVHSHDHAKAGLIPEAEHHRKQAQAHFDEYVGSLNNSDFKETAQKFSDEITPYFQKLDSIIDHAKTQAAAKPPKKSFISKLFGKSEENLTEAELEKALTTIQGLKPAKISTKVAVDRQPGKDPRYDYKPFHELSHDDQVKATQAFQAKDLNHHHYPVDKETGSFVHGATRWKQTTPSAPVNDKAVVAPEHRAGAFVRINAEGSPHHGKVGKVKMPNAHFPGKVPVQVGLKDHEMEYFDPAQVKLNKSDNEPNLEDLVSKSREVLASIKKGPE